MQMTLSSVPVRRLCLGLLGCGLITGGSLSSSLPPAIAQRVVDVTPRVNSNDTTPDSSISGVFANDSTGSVDAKTVRLSLNGQDVTAQSTITPSFFSYRPAQPLAPGTYQVRLDYKNLQGQPRSAGWQFTVSPQTQISLESVTHNGSTPLGAGATFLATLAGSRGAQASVLLVEAGQVVRSLPAQEVSPGVYVATLAVANNSNLKEGVVVGRLQRGAQITYGVAAAPAVFQGSAAAPAQPSTSSPSPTSVPPSTSTAPPAATAPTPPASMPAPVAPKLLSPTPSDRITTAGFKLRGETSPNATVQVRVTSTTAIFGVVSLGGERLVDRAVTADAQGQFEIQVPSPTVLQRDTRYSVVLEASLNGKKSVPTTVELRQR